MKYKYAGTHIEEYNTIIREAAGRYGCRVIELYQYKIPYDSIDGTDPNRAGMNSIGAMMIHSIIGAGADAVLDCDGGKHDYKAF